MLIQEASLPLDALLGPYGLVVFLIVGVVLGGLKKWWVFGWVYQEKVNDKEYWQGIAVKGLNIGQDAVKAAAKLAPEENLVDMARVVDEARREGKLP